MNKEVAERASGDNSILAQVNKRLDGFDQVFDAKIKRDIKEMTQELDKAIAEAKGVKEGLIKELQEKVVEPKVKEVRDSVEPKVKGLEEGLEKAQKRMDMAEVK